MASRNPRAAAQRRTAKLVREQRAARKEHRPVPKILPPSFSREYRRQLVNYANAVADGNQPYPEKGTAESKQLARMASFARWNKADPRYYDLFKQYFYHDERRQSESDADIEDEADYEEEEEDEE